MSSPAGINKDKVFLARNTGGRSRGAAADGSSLLEVLQGLAVANGLECKISCQNSKVCPTCAVQRGGYLHCCERPGQASCCQ